MTTRKRIISSLAIFIFMLPLASCGEPEDRSTEYYEEHDEDRQEKIAYCQKHNVVTLGCLNAISAEANAAVKKIWNR